MEKFKITEKEREEVFEMDMKISRMQRLRETGKLTKEMIEADAALETLKSLPTEI